VRGILPRLTVAAAAAMISICLSSSLVAAGEPERVAVLDTYGVWRMHCTLAPPALASGETVKLRYEWLNYRTAEPAEGWQRPDFDDATWLRGPVTLACKTALLSRVCLRGKFTVTSLEAVQGLALSVTYRGGLVVSVNGQEVKREHVASNAPLAEGPAGEERTLADFPVPAELLRQGMNLIGLEVVRAGYPNRTDEDVYEYSSCEILRARLSSGSSAGLIPNAARPEGFQVWNADAMAADFTVDFGDAAEALRPVTIVGARNGEFSGKVVVGSTRPIKGLKATPGELKGVGGTIPASCVDVRYGMPWGDQYLIDGLGLKQWSPYPVHANLLGVLSEELPREIAATAPEYQYTGRHAHLPKDAREVEVVPGAVAPVWITVKVPADAKAGTYAGKVRIEAADERKVEVAVELKVADYTLPNTQDYRTWVDLIQSPDTLSIEYGEPLWSEKHWEMIGRSFRLIGKTGSRTVYVPLIAHTNLGNAESMVRWVKKGDSYEYDFSVMDRYLDVAERNMGKPKLVIFVVWDVYMIPGADARDANLPGRHRLLAEHLERTSGLLGSGPMVTALEPSTGETELVTLPSHLGPAASKPLWQPLWDQLLARMRKRGLEDRIMLGLQGDAWASKEEHEFFKEITGGVPWVVQSHHGFGAYFGRVTAPQKELMHGVSKIGYQARMWNTSFADDGAWFGQKEKTMESLLGWKREELVAEFDRLNLDYHPSTRWRHFAEPNITGGQRGVGRIGADFWPVFKGKRGLRVSRVQERYPEADWRNLCIDTSLLAAAPEGPAASQRFEAFREGVQECEARIAIEGALSDEAAKDKLGANLVRRCEEYLAVRQRMMWLSLSNLQLYFLESRRKYGEYQAGQWRGAPNFTGHQWFVGSDWQARTEQLYALAGEVRKKLQGEETGRAAP